MNGQAAALVAAARESGALLAGGSTCKYCPDVLWLRDKYRAMCADGRCGRYGHNWACPPGCGSIEAAARRIAGFDAGILVQTTGMLRDDFDYESIAATECAHKRRFADFARQMRRLHPGCLPLTAGSCTLCARCTYPDRPCRYPTKRLSSMEAYGLFVSDICTRSGLAYNYGPRTMTYTSCVLYNKE